MTDPAPPCPDEQRLRQLHLDLELFARVTAHDLRGSLRGLRNLATWIQEDLPSGAVDERTREHLTRLHRIVHEAESIVDGLSDYAKLESRSSLPRVVDVESVVRDLVSEFALPPGFQITVEGEFPRITTVASALQRVVQALVDNCLEHHDLPEGRIWIRGAILEDTTLRIEVEDDGPGVDPRYHEKVFGPRHTLAAAGSPGMGLTTARRLVIIHGGTIRLDRVGDRGTRVTFTWKGSR